MHYSIFFCFWSELVESHSFTVHGLIQNVSHCLISQSPRGVYDIVVSGTCVGQYDNKGSFGELALMYNTPRAATIIATQEGSLWGLVREHLHMPSFQTEAFGAMKLMMSLRSILRCQSGSSCVKFLVNCPVAASTYCMFSMH